MPNDKWIALFVFFVPGMLKVSKRVYTDRAAEENGVCHEA